MRAKRSHPAPERGDAVRGSAASLRAAARLDRFAALAVTERTLPFVDAFVKKYGNTPSYAGYTAYDEVYIIADAIKRAGATESDKLVTAMEATDFVGTIGRVQFLPKGDPKVHGLRTGKGFITGLFLQWQDGKQVNIWPAELAKGKLAFPAFVKVGQTN